MPAYGLLLDEAGAAWRDEAKRGLDLGERLGRAVGLAPSAGTHSLRVPVAERAARYGGPALRANEEVREARRQERLASLGKKLVAGPVLTLPLSRPSISFDPRSLVPMPDAGTAYPTARVTDEWGVLAVTEDVLLDARWTKATLASVDERSGAVLSGRGWTLELAPGWSLVAGTRPGDYRLVAAADEAQRPAPCEVRSASPTDAGRRPEHPQAR